MLPQDQRFSADAPSPEALIAASPSPCWTFRWMWLTVGLSFGFYLPVVLWAGAVPMIGMLMIPRTCTHVWTAPIGYRAMGRNDVPGD